MSYFDDASLGGETKPNGDSSKVSALSAHKPVTDSNGVAKGQIDSSQLEARDRELAERASAIIRKRMSPPGALGLPKLLDQRRTEFGITDGAFERQAVFDRIYIWQIPMQSGDKFESDSLIHMPESVKQREKNKAPAGIIVSAGLNALDQLRSHGVDLGHKILFCHTAPYHIRYDSVLGVEQHLIILQACDIIGSEDLATNLKNREVRYLARRTETSVEHTFIDESGKPWLPADAGYSEYA
jgi:hypothetical protein